MTAYLYPLAYVIFILLITAWFGAELKRVYSFKRYASWLGIAVAVGIIGAVVFRAFPETNMAANFFLHATGGLASCCLFIYLIKTLALRFSWTLTTGLLFAFVSSAGVLNELGEYLLEVLGAGQFSLDSRDTWRDFVANTTGAAVAWTAYAIVLRIARAKSPVG